MKQRGRKFQEGAFASRSGRNEFTAVLGRAQERVFAALKRSPTRGLWSAMMFPRELYPSLNPVDLLIEISRLLELLGVHGGWEEPVKLAEYLERTREDLVFSHR